MTDEEPERVIGSVIVFPGGGMIASSDGGPIRVTVEGGGLTEQECAAVAESLQTGRGWPDPMPSGDGSKITVSFSGTPRPEDAPHWNPEDVQPVRDMILWVLRRKTGAATTPRNMAMWFGRPVAEVREELERLQREGLAEPLPARRGRERIWLLTEDAASGERP